MEIRTDFINTSTPAVSHSSTSFFKAEDSGYHTSFTPGSVEYSDISSRNLNAGNADATPGGSCLLPNAYKPRNVLLSKENLYSESELDSEHSPIVRRGVKRGHQDAACGVLCHTAPTPTTVIAGGLKRLKVTENAPHSATLSVSSSKSEYADSGVCELHQLSDYKNSYPSTPMKKKCKSSCKLSPIKRSGKKLPFTIHSISCASSGLQPVNKQRPHSKVVRTIQFKPEQKLDILKILYQRRVIPPLETIFSFMLNEDICNIKLVSRSWCHIWNEISNLKVKNDHFNYLKNIRENLENIESGSTPKNHELSQVKVLNDVHNVLNAMVKENTRSPPGTPRTNKFRKFTKSASLDSRLQLLCVRCAQPAKVTREISGEERAECTNSTCAYQFCRACNCDPHPGKSCIRYDLDGPSPSKRRKTSLVVGSMKSRKNLRRLL